MEAKYVSNAYAKGYINGYADGKFRANQEVSRLEFLKMLLSISGFKADTYDIAGKVKFGDDIPAWGIPYTVFAKEAGISTGVNGVNVFMPYKPISRAEAAKLGLITAKMQVENAEGEWSL